MDRAPRERRTSRRTAAFLATFGLVAGMFVLTGTARAEPTGGPAITVTLFNCSGPAGTPTSFQIMKEPNPGVAAHIVGSTDLFKRTLLTDLDAGVTVTWGPKNDDKPLITCDVVALNGDRLLVKGFIAGS